MTKMPVPSIPFTSAATRTPMLTVADLASVLSMSRRGVASMVRSGRIPYLRISNRIRFDPKVIDAWLNNEAVRGSGRWSP